eukprot:CAMPEP_0194311286 /NCGR_PEP_ID=MMETSP0171-20130528/8264_1 /TAXON_ID=218684 /ORGANISM="Corethron pennatum, Strain L29A3" /LENGTH=479 /DNA_ID=CAMNT_0039065319 /DNA_START=35 /DNA_END=1474 /DNA_ORIENTATION=+
MTDVEGHVKNPADPPAPRADPRTPTLSLFAVASVLRTDISRGGKYLHAAGALLFACVQNYAFYVMVVRASFPTCTSMTECPAGTFCANGQFALPTCYDCAGIEAFTQLNVTTVEEVCPAELGHDKWENRDYLDFDHQELWMRPDTAESTRQKCIGYLHCTANDLDAETGFEGRCDYLALHKSKMDGGSWFMVVFFAVLWSLPLTLNVQEATAEERVLDHHLTGGARNIPAEMVRLTLRIRRCVLPFSATAATLVLMITNDITAKHIILNFFSIIFLIEADNVAAVLFLGPPQQELMEQTVKEAASEKKTTEAESEKTAPEAESEKTGTDGASELSEEDEALWLWSRAQGVFCVVTLAVALAVVDTYVTECNDVQHFAETCLVLPAFLLLVLGQGVYRGCAPTEEETAGVRILGGLLEVFRNLFAYSLPVMFNVVVQMLLSKEKTLGMHLEALFAASIICLLLVIGIGTCKSKCGTRSKE